MAGSLSTCSGRGAIAVTPHHAATAAALRVMRDGGTAADAVIAANAVLGMVLPDTCGIGGDLFALVHRPGMVRPDVLNASGRAGSGLDAQALRDAGHTRMPTYGASTISVPGCVDGWEALQSRYGRLTLGDVLGDAIDLGENGFQVSAELAAVLERLKEPLRGQPSAAALYPHDTPPAAESSLIRPDLAATLRVIGEDGRTGFYGGAVASAITTATDGTLTEDDLATNSVDWVEPIGTEVFGLSGWTVPPNSQGYITLAAAWLFEQLDPEPDPKDPAFHHAAIEAYRAFAWERNDIVADPDHLPWDVDDYLAPARLAERLLAVRPDRAASWPEPSPGPAGTAYFCAIDGEGMAVSCIQSNYFGVGSRISAGTTGIFLHNRAAGFSLIPGHPNEAQPGKRPLHTLAPTMWTRDGTAALVLGTRGGDQQPQYLTQILYALLHAGHTAPVAQALPRWSVGSDSVVEVEAGMPDAVVSGLESRGHALTPGPDLTPGWGPVSLITIDPTGLRTGAADPRVTTATAAAG